ncbi:ATP-binding protein [Patulibacter americanus]|uniref:ATP-binding protein n=1 Tax=Patulibacter americanus TaxID=588672 RepID=UPI0003B6DF1D|nr:ATP-binding protein [Patulibacter americanus]
MSALLALGWLCAVTAASLLLLSRHAAHRSTERVVRACHELRGPLTNLTLALGEEGGDRPAALPALTLELARARRAVEELSAAAAGRVAGDERRGVEVGPLVRDLVAVHDVAARARGRRVVLADVLPADAHVVGDRARLAQAIGNLVQNALDHGEGTVRVAVDTHDGAVHVEVADEGHGLRVPVDALLRARRRGQRGRGMGIVADALAAHGGRLRTRPSAGGARMVAELPAAPRARRAVAP